MTKGTGTPCSPRVGLVPQPGNGVSLDGEAFWLLWASHLNTPVRRDEAGAPRLLKRLAGVGPVEPMGHRRVVVIDELSESRFEVGHRGEAAAAQAFPVDDAEDDLDLVEPRAVLGQVDEADPVADVREELATRRHRSQDAANVFFPRGSSISHRSATHSARPSEACVFRLSTMKIHSPAGSMLTVRAMWSTNSGSVRVAPNVGETISPVTTSRPAVSVVVPWRVYSNSCLATPPARAGMSGALRSRAWSDVASSTLTVCAPSTAALRGASR